MLYLLQQPKLTKTLRSVVNCQLLREAWDVVNTAAHPPPPVSPTLLLGFTFFPGSTTIWLHNACLLVSWEPPTPEQKLQVGRGVTLCPNLSPALKSGAWLVVMLNKRLLNKLITSSYRTVSQNNQ